MDQPKPEKASQKLPDSQKSRTGRAKQLRQKIAIRLGKLRKDANMTQAELAEAMAVTQNIIFRAENDGNISNVTLYIFFLYYQDTKGLNPTWLFSEDNEIYKQYLTPEDKKKSSRDSNEAKRKEIMDELVNNLRKAGLIKE